MPQHNPSFSLTLQKINRFRTGNAIEVQSSKFSSSATKSRFCETEGSDLDEGSQDGIEL
jgi:hypothetical protein